ncbi:MAG: SgcJ/EcaC family oxidoreductase [Chloroflexaceae bacterium]|nr:SgcJ/EcaC family oxidoreductase [Chloroflexaceae bacterium]
MNESMTSDDARSVLAAFEQWLANVSKGDPEVVAAMYAEDAVFFGTVSPYIRTNPEQVKHYFDIFKSQLPNLHAFYAEPKIRIYGDVALNTGYYTFFHERDGKMQSVPARYTFAYKKVNGEWKIIEHHSSAMPA